MRKRPRFAALALAILPLVAGCGASSSAANSPSPAAVSSGTGLDAQIASTDLAMGPNRFTFGLLDNNHPVETVRPHLTFFLIQGRHTTRMTSAAARFNQFAKGLKDTDANSAAVEIGGVYVAHTSFAKPGTWGVEIAFRYRSRNRVLRQAFDVAAHSQTPALGSPAPRTHNPTMSQEPATKLDSGRPPDDMHKLSVAAAIAQHKPLVVLFATAAYCTSRMCGPEIETVQKLENRYRGRVNFVHIEIYQDANPKYGYAPAVKQWHLQTEPWVFVVDRSGIITAKFEGPTPTTEIEPSMKLALRG